jgi:serine/threonine protein kinase
MSAVDVDRNLLFGVIALQDDLVDQKQFTEACAVWALHMDSPLADVLIERRWITPEDRREIDRKVERKIKKHGNVRASLAAAAGVDARDAIRAVDHPEIRKSLSSLPPAAGHVLVETLAPPYRPEQSRYTLTRMHAQGGLGKVWLAHDGDLRREVALKEILPERAGNPETWRRFLKEAQITGQLEHPNIVPVYELSRRKEDDQPFYVMRFVRGQALLDSLRDFHRERAGKPPEPLALQSLLGAFLKVCDAVAYAHSRGVVHRDLKPENIILGGFGEVIVLDWGLAKLVDQPEAMEAGQRISIAPDAIAAKTHGLVGTPSYMAPEQVEEKHDSIDGRTDVYALGAILFEIVTGHAPAEGTSAAEIFERIRSGKIPRARQIDTSVPAALDEVCAKAMALDRFQRYAKAVDLASDVRRWMADEPTSVYREPIPVRVRRWMRRHRTTTTAASAVVMVTLIALGIAYRRESVYSQHLAGINHSLDDANEKLTHANSTLASSNRELDLQRARAEERELLAIDAVTKFRDAVAGNPELKNRADLAFLRKKLLSEPLEFFRKLRSQLEAETGTGPMAIHRLALANQALATTTSQIGSVPDAIESYTEAIKLLESLVRENPKDKRFQGDLADSQNRIGTLLSNTGRTEEALTAYNEAITIWKRFTSENPTVAEYQHDLANCHNNLAILFIQTGRSLDALREYETALKIWDRLVNEDPSVAANRTALATGYSNLAVILREMGRSTDALKALEKSVKIMDRLASENPTVAVYQHQLAASHANMGVLLRIMGQPEEALNACKAAVRIDEQLVRQNPTFSEYLRNLAGAQSNVEVLLREAGRLEDALDAYSAALKIRVQLASDNPSVPLYQTDLAATYNNGGLLMRAMGKHAEARKAVDAAFHILERLARDHPQTPEYQSALGGTINSLAEIAMDLRAWTEAQVKLRKAIELERVALKAMPQSPEYLGLLGIMLGNLAKVEQAMGHGEAAAHATREWGEVVRGDPLETYNVACSLVMCVPISKPAVRSQLAAESVAYLRAAVAAGWNDASHTARDPDLAPLRQRADFQHLLAEMFDRIFPVDPFARP